MRKLALSVLFLTCGIFIQAQNKELRGKVLFQNSGKEPANGVKVYGQGANGVPSTRSGSFVLVYPRKAPGDAAGVSIGPADEKGVSLEVVNTEAVNNARIPRESTDEMIIVVCQAGKLAEAKQYYYNLCDENLRKKYQQLKSEKEKLLAKANVSAREKVKLQSQIDSLDATLQAALIKVEELAGYIASVNKDFAVGLVKEAIAKIEKEQDIEGALAILDDNKLNELYEAALARRMKAEDEIRRVIEGYELKIELLSSQFRYREILSCYNKIIKIYEETKLDDFYLKLAYLNLAHTYDQMGQTRKSLEIHKSINKKFDLDKLTISGATLILGNLAFIGQRHADLRELDSALSYLNSALELTEHLKTRKDSVMQDMYRTMLITIYDGLDITYRKADSLEKAIEMGLAAIEITEKYYGVQDPRLAILYHNVSMAYLMSMNMKKAMEYEQHSINLKESAPKRNVRSLASSYLNLSLIQYAQAEHRDAALGTLYKSKDLYESILESTHPSLSAVYNRFGKYYQTFGEYDSALYYYRRAIDIDLLNEETDGHKIVMGDYYETMAEKKYSEKKYAEAIIYYDSAYAIHKNPEHIHLIGVAYSFMEEHAQAIAFYKKALLLDTEKKIDYIHNDLGYSYAMAGQLEEAYASFKTFEQQHIDTARSYRNWAMYYALRNDKEKALANLELAIKHGYANKDWILKDRSLNSIRDDKRYKDLIEKLKGK